ncbi:MAG: glycosyl hydrolase family 18 protein, partial [Planctomycetota bacterium]
AGTVGATLNDPLVVRAEDRFGNPVLGATVDFRLTVGAGSLAPRLFTDAAGEARTSIQLGSGAGPHRVEAAAIDLVGVTINFDLEARPGPAVSLIKVSGDNQVRPIASALDPFVVAALDAFGNPVPNTPISFAITDATSVGSMNPFNTRTDANGEAETAVQLSPTPGTAAVQGRVPGVPGAVVTFTANAIVGGIATAIRPVSGGGQAVPVRTVAAFPMVFEVVDTGGAPVAGVLVSLEVASGDLTLGSALATSNAAGRVQTSITGGTVADAATVSATAVGATSATLGATVVAGPLARIEATRGDGQIGLAGLPLPAPLVVTGRDAFGNAVSQVPVTFQVTEGTGTLDPSVPVVTDAEGEASVEVVLGAIGLIEVEASAVAGPPVVFRASTPGIVADVIVQGDRQTGFAGATLAEEVGVRVLDVSGQALGGITAGFAVTGGSATLGATSVVSDSQGVATTTLTLGATIGGVQVTVITPGPGPHVLTAAIVDEQLAAVSGDGQQGRTGATLRDPLIVELRNAAGQLLAGRAVLFSVTSGQATLGAVGPILTDAQGRAQTTVTLGGAGGEVLIEASLPGTQVQPLVLRAEARDAIALGYVETLRGGMTVNDVNYAAVDFVVHAFLFPDASGSLQQSFNFTRFRNQGIVGLAHAAGARIVVSVGGATSSQNLSAVAADPTRRNTMITQIVAFMQANDYDGVDLDWEFPANAADRQNFTTLMTELFQAVKAADPDLTVMFGVSTGFFLDRYDFAALTAVSDYALYFGYDWNNPANGPLTHPTETLTMSAGVETIEASVRGALDFILAEGYSPEKLIMGIPFYSSTPQTSWFDIRPVFQFNDPQPHPDFFEAEIEGRFWNTPKAIRAKMEAVLEAPSILQGGDLLGGVGVWEFGHEGTIPDLSATVRDVLEGR